MPTSTPLLISPSGTLRRTYAAYSVQVIFTGAPSVVETVHRWLFSSSL